VIAASLDWRDVTVLRAVGRFLRQAAMTFSLAYMQQALVRNPDVAALLVALFYARNAPNLPGIARNACRRSKSISPRR
jgi:glutamate dehydrogenase